MRALIILCLSLFVCTSITHAQTMIYSQDFETTYPEWTLNSTVTIAGVAGTNNAPSGNEWLINNVYAAGILGTATPHETAGIIGEPTSYYLHMNCGNSLSADYGLNDNYLANGSGEVYIAQMTTPQVTTGFTNVYFSFWWLCRGDATGDEGNVYYSTDGGTTWTQITGTNFYSTTTWSLDSLHLAAFDNQASLEFAFTFTDANTGAHDPEFAIDDVSLYGTGSVVTAPVASFTNTATTACQDSCISFTSTSTGTVTSYSWVAVGATVASSTASSTSICFPSAGTYTVTLYAYNGTAVDSASTVISVTPTPSPVITQAGDVLSVPAVYTSYQWYTSGPTPIPGATTNSYTISAAGLYGIEVDSAGCIGFDTLTASTLHINTINNLATSYWISQINNSSVSVNASKPLNDALAITIYDATGRKVLDEIWDAGSYTKQINNLSVATGLYIIKLSNTYTSQVFKWLKP